MAEARPSAGKNLGEIEHGVFPRRGERALTGLEWLEQLA